MRLSRYFTNINNARDGSPSLVILVLVIASLLLEELHTQLKSREKLGCRMAMTYLDKRLGGLEEVLPSLGLRALLVPVYDGLIRDTVFVVQNLQHANEYHRHAHVNHAGGAHLKNLRERLHEARVFVTIHLHRVDEGDLSFGPVAEGLYDVAEGLSTFPLSEPAVQSRVRSEDIQ